MLLGVPAGLIFTLVNSAVRGRLDPMVIAEGSFLGIIFSLGLIFYIKRSHRRKIAKLRIKLLPGEVVLKEERADLVFRTVYFSGKLFLTSSRIVFKAAAALHGFDVQLLFNEVTAVSITESRDLPHSLLCVNADGKTYYFNIEAPLQWHQRIDALLFSAKASC